MTEPPAGWGSDELSEFFEAARNNSFATYHLMKSEYTQLLNIDGVFSDLLEDWKDPSDIAAAPFAYRAHSAYRVAVQLATAGQVPESYMVMRGCLENALYGQYIKSVPAAFDTWRRRGENEEDRRKCVREFSGRNLFETLKSRHQQLGDAAGSLYERTIDLGAHPNERGLLSTLSVEEGESEHSFNLAYLTGGTMMHKLALRSCAQVGVVVLDIFALVFPDAFRERKLERRLAVLRVGL